MILGTSSYASVELGGVKKQNRLFGLTDGVVNTDTFLKGLYRSFTESITNSDTFAGIKVLFALFTEAIRSTDTLIKTISKNLSETVQNTDTLIKTTIKNFRESITNSDTLNTLKFVVLNLFESVKSTASLWINGMFIDTWWTKRIKPIINWIKRNKPQ
jgi:gas vesicle protein